LNKALILTVEHCANEHVLRSAPAPVAWLFYAIHYYINSCSCILCLTMAPGF